MLMDPVSALVVAGALGVSGVLRHRDQEILAAIERKLEINEVQQVHRIVVKDLKQVIDSPMDLNA